MTESNGGSFCGSETRESLPEDAGRPNREECALLAAMADRRPEALNRLYALRGPALYSLLLHMVRSNDEAEELLQDAFVLIWRRAASFDSERSSPWTWMVMLARGLAIDRLRRRERRRVHHAAYEQEIASLEVEEVDHRHSLAGREVSERVTRALRALPDPQREAIELAFYRGWSHQEIARANGQPLGTVKSHIRRGMLTLRQLLKDFYV